MAVLYRWLFEFDFMSLDFTDIYKVERFDPFDSERVPLFFLKFEGTFKTGWKMGIDSKVTNS